jgi:DUF1680 family protein
VLLLDVAEDRDPLRHRPECASVAQQWGRIRLRQETDYPWSGGISIVIDEAPDRDITLKLRIPGWVRQGDAAVAVNGTPCSPPPAPGTYAVVSRRFVAGDRVEVSLPMPATFIEAHPAVEEAFGQVAVRRGPLVYCLESNELPDGTHLADVVVLTSDAADALTTLPLVIDGRDVLAIRAAGAVVERKPWTGDELYRPAPAAPPTPVPLTLIPYYAWGNRGDTEMTVWLRAR